MIAALLPYVVTSLLAGGGLWWARSLGGTPTAKAPRRTPGA